MNVVVPHTGGELASTLERIEQCLLHLAADEQPASPFPVPLARGESLARVRRLASLLAEADSRPDVATVPVGPDGVELAPLLFHKIARRDVGGLEAAYRQLDPPWTLERDPVIERALLSLDDLVYEEPDRLFDELGRLVRLLQIGWDDEISRLRERLDGTSAESSARVLLADKDHATYQRVALHIVRTWHAGDPLEAIAYRCSID